MKPVARDEALVEQVDRLRLNACRTLNAERRSEMGQFLTPIPVARFMASLFAPRDEPVRLLDAGAGVGSLTAAFVAFACRWERPPAQINATAYELDPGLAAYLASTFEGCRLECLRAGSRFSGEIHDQDFIGAGVAMLRSDLFGPQRSTFNCAILNPPYHKITSDSEARVLLRSIGVETTNLYTGFLSIVIELLEPGGELVAITPRSFCNGPYFKSFRSHFLATMALRRIHVFDSREEAFRGDDVLQENIIFHAVKGRPRESKVIVSSSVSAAEESITLREVDYDRIVRPGDPDQFIHIVTDELGTQVAERMRSFQSALQGACTNRTEPQIATAIYN